MARAAAAVLAPPPADRDGAPGPLPPRPRNGGRHEAAAIADYDRRRTAAGRPVPPDQQLDVEQWGVADPYGWSVEKARMVARRERDQLARFLADRGFGLG